MIDTLTQSVLHEPVQQLREAARRHLSTQLPNGRMHLCDHRCLRHFAVELAHQPLDELPVAVGIVSVLSAIGLASRYRDEAS